MGGVRKNFGEFGGGFVLSGDARHRPNDSLPCSQMLLGKREVAMFGFGVRRVPLYDLMPCTWRRSSRSNKVAVKPWVKVGTRLNLVPEEHSH